MQTNKRLRLEIALREARLSELKERLRLALQFVNELQQGRGIIDNCQSLFALMPIIYDVANRPFEGGDNEAEFPIDPQPANGGYQMYNFDPAVVAGAPYGIGDPMQWNFLARIRPR
jgi:hypothetical protein